MYVLNTYFQKYNQKSFSSHIHILLSICNLRHFTYSLQICIHFLYFLSLHWFRGDLGNTCKFEKSSYKYFVK